MIAPLVSLVIPTFNEAANILPLLNDIHQALGEIPHEVIVVDDDSPDATWRVVESFARLNHWVRCERRTGERDLSTAVLAGFRLAGGDVLGVMDGDCSHDPAILGELVTAVQNGAELSVGSRRIPGGGATEWPWIRRRMSDAATWATKRALRVSLSDPMSGYFFLSRTFYDGCKDRIQAAGYKILLAFYCTGRPKRVIEIPYVFRPRHEGYSKLSPRVIREFFRMLRTLPKNPAS